MKDVQIYTFDRPVTVTYISDNRPIKAFSKKRSSHKLYSNNVIVFILCLAMMLITIVLISAERISAKNVQPQEDMYPLVIDDSIQINNSQDDAPHISLLAYNEESNTETISRDEKIYSNCELPVDLQWYAYDLCTEYEVPFNILISLIWEESKYDSMALSEDGYDKGLCQIRESNFKWLYEEIGVTNLLDPKDNIYAAVYMLHAYMDQYPNENMHVILMCYNLGPTGAKSYWDRGIYSTDYTWDIVDYSDTLK